MSGGLTLVEITVRNEAAGEVIRTIANAHPSIAVGAGTLLHPDQVFRARDAGAAFGVAPGFNAHVVAAAASCGLSFYPGVATPTDIEEALSARCDVLKFFPAEINGGINALKLYDTVYGHTGVKFVATGGITAANLREYLALPNVVAAGGSWIADPRLIAGRQWTEITRRAAEAIAAAACG